MKTCTKCKAEKERSQFYKKSDSKDKLTTACKSCMDKRNMILHVANREKRCADMKKRRDADLETARAQDRERYPHRKALRQANKEKVTLDRRNYETKKRNTDPFFRLRKSIRHTIWCAVTRQGSPIKSLTKRVGCDSEVLRAHIEAQFQDGMNWENYGLWHVDHIIPLSFFDLSKEYHLDHACNYLNLRPLWAKDNLTKHARLEYNLPRVRGPS